MRIHKLRNGLSVAAITQCSFAAYVKSIRKVNCNIAGIPKAGVLYAVVFAVLFSCPVIAYAQTDSSDAPDAFTLQQCIDYAMKNQPAVNQSLINISIARTTNAINLAAWLPQVNLGGSSTHYAQLPTNFISDSLGGTPIPTHSGIANTFIPQATATQAIFSPQLLYAARSAKFYVKEAQLVLDTTKINMVTTVSKAFYNLLLTLEQIKVLKEDTARLQRNVMDTYHQFVGGIVDETDYDEAVITLNNSKAQLRQQLENLFPNYATLKQLIGYPPRKQFNVVFDTAQMMQEIDYDTTRALEFSKRVEFEQVQTAKMLQRELINYYRLAFLPTLSVYYNYNYEFESQQFSTMFNRAYPYSYFGINFSIPIFTGFARLENVHKARLQENLLDWAEVSTKSQIYTEYATALANYKYNLYNWNLLKENIDKAKNVYRIVQLQYKEGIVAYLNMIVAENNLITAEIGYTNALFQLLSSKVDLEKAMGDIPYNSPTR